MNARAAATGRTVRRFRPRSGGFTLVEVLVTAAVTIVAFTGLATLQMLALCAASSALERSQATALAYDVIDRLRLNRGANGVSDTALGGGYDGKTLCKADSRHPDDTRPCTYERDTDFNGTETVTLDLREWWRAVDAAQLTSWYAGILRTDERFLVSVQWDDTRAEAVPDGAPALKASCLGVDMPTTMQEVCVETQL